MALLPGASRRSTRPPAAADLARLPLTDAVLHEAIRLYPPAWALGVAVAGLLGSLAESVIGTVAERRGCF